MKIIILVFLILPNLVFAQKMDIKDVETDSDTTIQISKGKKAIDGKCEPIWEVVEGSADVSGESSLLAKDASQSWKKACDTWLKDFKAENKEQGNKILVSSCGTSTCTTDAAGKICTSKATYKLKTKLN